MSGYSSMGMAWRTSAPGLQMVQMLRARDAAATDSAAAHADELASRAGREIAALRSALGEARSEAETSRVDLIQLIGGTRIRLEAEAQAHGTRIEEQLTAGMAEVRREVVAAVEIVRADGVAVRNALESVRADGAAMRSAVESRCPPQMDACSCTRACDDGYCELLPARGRAPRVRVDGFRF